MQVLVQAAGQMRAAGAQLSGPGRLPVLLWVINQVRREADSTNNCHNMISAWVFTAPAVP
jgi:hypothetical protein